MTFDGEELYPTIVEKASALGFSLVMKLEKGVGSGCFLQDWSITLKNEKMVIRKFPDNSIPKSLLF